MKLPLTLLVVAVAASCATSKSAASAPTSRTETPPTDVKVEGPPDAGNPIEALFSRELPPLGRQVLALERASLDVEAKGTPKVTRDDTNGATQVTLPLGTEQDVTCFVYDHPVDVSGALSHIIESVRAQYTLAAVRPAGIEVIEKSPALFVEVVYVVQSPQGKKVGSLKLMAVSSETAPVSCLHDEPGYGKTFQRVSSAFAAAVARARTADAVPASYRTIDVTSVKGMRVGFTKSSWVKKRDGSLVIVTVSATFTPRSPTEYLSEDSVSVTEADPAGYVRKREHVSSANGEKTLDVKLVHEKGPHYAYSGEASGKALAGKVEAKNPRGLESPALEFQRTRDELLTGKVPSLAFESYAPSVNPVGLERATLTLTTGRKATLKLGSLSLNVEIDAHGDLVASELPVGPVTVVTQQLLSEGAP